METHDDLTQFLRIEQGEGKAILNGEEHELKEETALIVPEGTEHNIINTGTVDLKLYTIYTPPQHPPGTVEKTKEEADRAFADLKHDFTFVDFDEDISFTR